MSFLSRKASGSEGGSIKAPSYDPYGRFKNTGDGIFGFRKDRHVIMPGVTSYEETKLAGVRKYVEEAGLHLKIDYRIGNAAEIIPTLDIKFDLVFIDADKENYINYFELIVPKMNKGGIILSDNVLWSGKVLEPLHKNDSSTKILLEYNALLKNDPRVESVLLPIRDGLTVSRIL